MTTAARRKSRSQGLLLVAGSLLLLSACGDTAQESPTDGSELGPEGTNGAPDDTDPATPGTAPGPGGEPEANPETTPSEVTGPNGPTPPTPSGVTPNPGEPEPTPTPTEPVSVTEDTITRVARLSLTQYQNTVSDLLGIDDPPGDTFAPDALNGFNFDTSVDYRVDARLGPQYRTAAEELGVRAVTDDAVFTLLVTCDAAASSCASEFVQSFGQRAFRRPLTAEQQTRFETLFARGPELVASGDDFRDGVQLVVEAMLQSPQFLYRTELSATAGANGRIALDSWEVASRLSYLLWNSMPDDNLFAIAERGELQTSAQIAAAATTMLSAERTTEKLVSFHEQAWHFSRFSKISPDQETYPDAPENLSQLAMEAGRLFVDDVLDSGGGFNQLLSAPYGYADENLAGLYGSDVSGGFARVDFNDRKGLLMQVGFLASNAYAIKTDPIHRGLFVVRDLLCRQIPDPPAGASQTPPPETDTPPQTTREEVALLTGQDACVACHTQINPAGFAFEGFDAAGQVRDTENGVAVDTSGSLLIDGAMLNFSDASQLVDALAVSSEAKRCYSSKLISFAFGHDASPDDATLDAALDAEQSTKTMATLIAESPGFRERVPNEVAP